MGLVIFMSFASTVRSRVILELRRKPANSSTTNC